MSELDPYFGIPHEVVRFASSGPFSTEAVIANYHLAHQLPLIAAANNVEPYELPQRLVQRAEDHAYRQLVSGHVDSQSVDVDRLHRDVFGLAGMVVAEHPFDLGDDTQFERALPLAVQRYRRRQ